MLERDRHEQLIGELREAGARVKLIRDGDVAPAIAAAQAGHAASTCSTDRRHAGGRHLGGGVEVRRRRDPGTAVAARTTRSGSSCSTQGSIPTRVLHANDLVAGEDVFVAATGVTNGPLLAACSTRRAAR